MLDLPLADSEGAIEKQLKTNNGKFHEKIEKNNVQSSSLSRSIRIIHKFHSNFFPSFHCNIMTDDDAVDCKFLIHPVLSALF